MENGAELNPKSLKYLTGFTLAILGSFSGSKINGRRYRPNELYFRLSKGAAMRFQSRPFYWWSLLLNIIALAAMAFMLAKTVAAGDLANRHIIGFSPSGDYFAFEEYGRQDGSGFPYSNIYVIDTQRNKWVRGSPFRVLVKNENASVKLARNKARSKFRAMRRRLNIFRKGRLLASNPVTELSANPHRVEVALRSPMMTGDPEAGNPLEFSLREFDLPSPACRRFTERRTKGFVWRVRRAGERAVVLHRDKRIPKSRGCPFNYAISDVVSMRKRDGSLVYVVITSVFRHGFEGTERRFIAGAYHDDGRRRPRAYRQDFEGRDVLDAETYEDPDRYWPSRDSERRHDHANDPFDR